MVSSRSAPGRGTASAGATRKTMPRKKSAAAPDTAQRILDIAERLVQTRGFNGFSYADIAGALRLHQGEPALSLPHQGAARHAADRALRARVPRGARRNRPDAAPTPREKLRRYAKIYADVLRAQPDVPVRDARRRVRHAAEADEGGDAALLRRERALARRRPGAGARGPAPPKFTGSPSMSPARWSDRSRAR